MFLDVSPLICYDNCGVYGLLTVDDGKAFKRFLDDLSKDADGNVVYKTTYYLLDAASFGVPQYRSRVIVFGAKNKKISCPAKTHAINAEDDSSLLSAVTVEDAIGKLHEPTKVSLPNHVGRVHGADIIRRYSALKYGERDSKTRINRLNPNKPGFTIVVGSDKGGGKGHVHPYTPREVTPRESARLQSFPDYWAFTGTSRHPIRQVGNAVPPIFAAAIGAHLLKEVFNVNDTPDYNKIIDLLGLEYLKSTTDEYESQKNSKAV